MTAIESLIAMLRHRSIADGTWAITSDELSDIFDPVELYRAAFQVDLLGVDRFGPENAGELAEVVSAVVGRDAREELRGCGLYLSYEDRIELTGRFVRSVQAAIVLHTPDPETFRAMLRQFRRYDRAELVYIDTYLTPSRIVDRCCDDYLHIRAAGEAETTLRATVTAYLGLLLRRHIVEIRSLGEALFEILRTVARQDGFLRSGGGQANDRTADGERAGARQSDDSPAISVAAEVLGLSRFPAPRAEVQKAYRRKMQKYHPDINPKGLEMAKRVNQSYAVLLSALGD